MQNMQKLEEQLKEFVLDNVSADSAHDINHIERVVKAAKQFADKENASLEVIIPAAWLHDCVSLPKNHPDSRLSSQKAAKRATEFLQSIDYPEKYFADIEHAIEAHSYSAGIPVRTVEAAIVQDADRIDALGAIGIARCIQVSTGFGASLYSNDDPFCVTRAFNDKAFAVDHFYNKLFKLQDTMNTEAAKEEAKARTQYMKGFLSQLSMEISLNPIR